MPSTGAPITPARVTALLAVLLLGASTWAQPGPRPDRDERPTPEQREAVWTLQARSVAGDLALDETRTASVVAAYVETRETLHEAVVESRRERADERGRRGARGDRPRGPRRQRGDRGAPIDPEIVESARDQLETALAGALDEKAAAKAGAALGAFSPVWDRLVLALVRLELDDEARTLAAVPPTRAFADEIAALREAGDREAMRDGLRAARDAMLVELGEILSEDELKTFEASIRPRRDGRRAGRGGDRFPPPPPGELDLP